MSLRRPDCCSRPVAAEIVAVAQAAGTLLAPALPYLVQAGRQAAEEASKALGEEAWRRAQAVWNRLRPGLEANPAVERAITKAVETKSVDPAALADRLAMLLEDEPELVAALRALLPARTQTETSTVIRGDVRGNVFGGPVEN